MANKNTKRRNLALRKAGEHFHGACCTNKRVGRKSRDADRKLLAQGQKRKLDPRITEGRFARLAIYA